MGPWQKWKRGGINDWKSNLGIRNLLAKMNIRLCDNLKKLNNIYVIDFEKLKSYFNEVKLSKTMVCYEGTL